MGFLYVNAKGQPWRKHSYSAGNIFDACPLKYYLQKVMGWKEKNKRARFELGKAFETAIQFYHENSGDRDAAIKCFLEQWEPFRKVLDLQYTRVEKDWETCAKIGTDWMKLYAIRQPKLPIPLGGQALFQREYSKEVFPNDPTYGEIEYMGKLDIVAFVEPTHPMLPRLEWKPEYGAFRPLIVDIKTAGADFPDSYGIVSHDTQLRSYSWLSGYRDVAFLWFVKKALAIQKGYSVTLLEDAGYMKAGAEAVVAGTDGDGAWLLPNDFMVEEMERVQGKKGTRTDTTKEALARRDEWLEENATWAKLNQITKQRLQFNAGYVSMESAEDAGRIAQRQIIRIVNAWREHNGNIKGYENTFSVRYPHNDLTDPYFRAFILKDKNYRDQNFEQSDKDDLFAEDDKEDREEL